MMLIFEKYNLYFICCKIFEKQEFTINLILKILHTSIDCVLLFLNSNMQCKYYYNM